MGVHENVVDTERAHRLQKLEQLRERGVDPYPVGFRRDHTVADVRERFTGLAPDAQTGEPVRAAGRLMLVRRHGGLLFATRTAGRLIPRGPVRAARTGAGLRRQGGNLAAAHAQLPGYQARSWIRGPELGPRALPDRPPGPRMGSSGATCRQHASGTM